MSNEIKLTGFKEFGAKLKQLPGKMQVNVDAYVFDAAKQWEQLAKNTAPVNLGRLRSQISGFSTGNMTAEVVSPVLYSPYVEWGTGSKVSVPADLVSYALRFKGVRETLGRNPHAFFFIHKLGIEKTLFARIDKYLNTPQ